MSLRKQKSMNKQIDRYINYRNKKSKIIDFMSSIRNRKEDIPPDKIKQAVSKNENAKKSQGIKDISQKPLKKSFFQKKLSNLKGKKQNKHKERFSLKLIHSLSEKDKKHDEKAAINKDKENPETIKKEINEIKRKQERLNIQNNDAHYLYETIVQIMMHLPKKEKDRIDKMYFFRRFKKQVENL